MTQNRPFSNWGPEMGAGRKALGQARAGRGSFGRWALALCSFPLFSTRFGETIITLCAELQM